MNIPKSFGAPRDKKIVRAVTGFVLIAAYPLWYMSVAIWNCVGCLVSSKEQLTQLTDVSGFVLRLQSLQYSDFLSSSSSFTGGTTGDPLWRWQEFTQLPLGVLGWFYSLFLDAFTATSVTTLTLWILSGCAAFLLMREIGVNYWVAVAATVIFEMLPFHRVNAANYIAYLMIGVTLLCVYGAIRFLRNPTWFSGCLLVSMFLIAVVSDGYLMYFSWYAIVVIFVVNLGLLRQMIVTGQKLLVSVMSTLLVGLFLALIFGGYLLDHLQQSSTVSRPLEVITRVAMNARASSPLEMFEWTDDAPLAKILGATASTEAQIPYVGIILAICAAAATLDAIFVRRINQRWVLSIAIVAIFMWSLTLRSSFEFFSMEIPLPADLIRQISPGLQYFVRAGLVVQALMVVLAASYISNLASPLFERHRWPKPAVSTLLLVMIVVDLAPFTTRYQSQTAALLAPISEQIEAKGDGRIFAYPRQYFGRDWLAQVHLRQPFLNARYRPWPWRTENAGVEENSSDVRCSLLAIGARYLLYAPNAPVGSQEFKFVPDDRIFPVLAESEISAYEAGVGLLQLRLIEPPGEEECQTASLDVLG